MLSKEASDIKKNTTQFFFLNTRNIKRKHDVVNFGPITQVMTQNIVLCLLIIFCLSNGCIAAPSSIFGFAEYEPYETPTPVAKLNVVYDKYVDVIVGNPGRSNRLRIDFSQNTSLVLFTIPDDLSKEYSNVPPTMLVYFGPALVRVNFRVDLSLYDSKSPIKYDGLLGLGYGSDIWNYWALVSVSSRRLVLGEFDKSISRATYSPFRLDFTRANPDVSVRVYDQNFSLTYDPAEYYSTFPRILYHNVTNFDLKFNKLHMEIDNNDIKMRLTSGFDRTLIRKNLDFEDTRIILGQHFAHNFVLYYDVVNQTKHLMPAFDLFSLGHAEELYSNTILTLYFLLFIVWVSLITTTNTTESSEEITQIAPIIFSGIEFYTYIITAILSVTEISAFAYYRHLAFLMSTTSTASYVVFNTLLSATTIAGGWMATTHFNTKNWLNVRRVFVEAVLTLMLWIILSHWTHVMATFAQVFIVALYCILRGLQTSMAIIMKNYRVLIVAGAYFVFSMLFYVFFVMIPIINFYFYGFAHPFNTGVFIFSFTLAIPLLVVLAFYPQSLIRNSIIDIDRRHHLNIVNQNPSQLLHHPTLHQRDSRAPYLEDLDFQSDDGLW